MMKNYVKFNPYRPAVQKATPEDCVVPLICFMILTICACTIMSVVIYHTSITGGF